MWNRKIYLQRNSHSLSDDAVGRFSATTFNNIYCSILNILTILHKFLPYSKQSHLKKDQAHSSFDT